VVLALPLVGILAYIMFGEVNIGRRRIERLRAVERRVPQSAPSAAADLVNLRTELPGRCAPLFAIGRSISGFEPVAGNSARLMEDSNAAIASIVADIDAAREHVHVLFYIWLTDGNGCRVADALMRAAARGVTCRAMADNLGSRGMLKSAQWKAMRDAGVKLGVALDISFPLLRAPFRRVDLRNHRKIVVIDNAITYCGSQNCADPEFLVKAKFAPWVDAVMRSEGPIAQQNQRLFAIDWMSATGEDIDDLLRQPPARQPACRAGNRHGADGPPLRHAGMFDR
jgi:cardiolipin synthase